jgi:indole-3-glycerol phosphate synthase
MSYMSALGGTVAEIVSHKVLEEHSRSRSMRRLLQYGHRTGVKVITEVKPSSPNSGILMPLRRKSMAEVVRKMEIGGAHAISVLVEPRKFNGSMEVLEFVRGLTDLPLLAKGFHFDPLHLAQCKAAGADAYLQMVRVVDVLGKSQRKFLQLGASLGLEAMVEANSKSEVEKALDSGSEIVSVNNRRIYDDMKLDLEMAALGRSLPPEIVFVSASGIESPRDLRTVYENSGRRVDAVLVGTSVMRAENTHKQVEILVNAGKRVVHQ